MIIEDYVSIDTAKLLEDRGFDNDWEEGSIAKYFQGIDGYCLPTIQVAMKWLREVHNIQLWAEPYEYDEGIYNAHVRTKWFINQWQGVGYKSFEEACEGAIKYCLENLI